MLIDLIQNIALIVMLAVGLQFMARRLQDRFGIHRLIEGLLFGLVGVLGMMTPIHFAPGVIYDGRSIVLSLAGLFGGPFPALVGASICGWYRWNLGGAGAWAGLGVILESTALGTAMHYLRRRDEKWVRPSRLMAFGILVHAIMLGLQLTIPGGTGWQVAREFGFIIVFGYPLAFLIAANVFLNIERLEAGRLALAQSEERYRSLFENNHAVMLVIDPEDGRVVDANPAARAFYGWTRDDLRNTNMSTVNTLSADEVRHEMERARKGEASFFEFRHRLADGSVRDVEVFSGTVHVLGRPMLYSIVHDVSARHAAEEALIESRDDLKRAQTLAQIGSWRYDPSTDTMSAPSESRAILGIADDAEPLLDRVNEAILPQYRPMQDAALKALIEEGTPYDIEFDARRPSDNAIRRIHSVAEYDARHNIVVGAIQDITDRKRAEDERERLRENLAQARKMESVGQLAGGIAHDFNNLLQAILGYGELALADMGADVDRRQNIEEVLAAARRAENLVRQLLAFSRRQVLDMKDINLNDAIEDTLKMLRRIIGEHVVLDFGAGRDLRTVRADPGQIGQILTNLCLNARDAMPDGGTVTIKTANIRFDEAYCAANSWAKPGDFVLMSVTDTGHGIEEEALDRIFEPFYTTKGLGKGTGLGLATVYGLVKQHDGLIRVSSDPRRETCFAVYLPAVERPPAVEPEKTLDAAPEGTETILLAEDEAMVRNLTRTLLERAGYTVLVAADGEEAVEVFERNAGRIDLSILDVMMPKLGGRAVYERMRRTAPEARVLFASGYSMDAIDTNFELEAGISLIQKPYSRHDLLRKVRETLDMGGRPA